MRSFFKKFKNKEIIIKTQKLSNPNPHRHWTLLVRTFSIIVVILISASLYFLYKIKNEEIFQVEPVIENNQISIDKDLFNKVTESFNKKAEKGASIKDNISTYRDPGL